MVTIVTPMHGCMHDDIEIIPLTGAVHCTNCGIWWYDADALPAASARSVATSASANASQHNGADVVTISQIEYDCADCGRHVIAYGFYGVAETGKRCSSCDWIRAHILPDEQAEVRARLGVPLTAPYVGDNASQQDTTPTHVYLNPDNEPTSEHNQWREDDVE